MVQLEGLEIDEKQFNKLNQKDQLAVIYKNTLSISKKVDKYKFHQKVQYVVMTLIAAGLTWLSQLHVK